MLQRGGWLGGALDGPVLDKDDVEDLEDAPDAELEAAEEKVLEAATAARSSEELRIEIEMLRRLEELALPIWRGGTDKKWSELANLLGEIFTPATIRGVAQQQDSSDPGVPIPPKPTPSPHQKLVVFTEHATR